MINVREQIRKKVLIQVWNQMLGTVSSQIWNQIYYQVQNPSKIISLSVWESHNDHTMIIQ